MTIFKTFFKVIYHYKVPIILYSILLVIFSGINMQSNQQSLSFLANKSDILIINHDEEEGLTKGLINYFKDHAQLIEIEDDETAINDALFYREVSYVIYIPEGFREDFLNDQNPVIEIQSTDDYHASLAQMLLERYLKVARTYHETFEDEDVLIEKINETLHLKTTVELSSTLDTTQLERMTLYYNFMNYCLLAGLIYVIGIILSSFRKEGVKKRALISCMNERQYHRRLLLASTVFALALWGVYTVLGYVLLGSMLWQKNGLIYLLNSFLFTGCIVTLAFLIANLITDKNAINGLVNVIALGSSFLCGAFVPMEWLPDSVLTVAHLLPSYWFIKTNECLKTIEVIDLATLKEPLFNMMMLIIFSMLFISITYLFSIRQRKLNK